MFRASWEKQRARSKILTEAEIRERIPHSHPLACPIDSKLFLDPVKTPCCATTFCQECLYTHLSDHDFLCPNCHQKIATLASVRPDAEAKKKVEDYIDAAFEEHRQQEVKNANVVAKVCQSLSFGTSY
jgi:protein MPE1